MENEVVGATGFELNGKKWGQKHNIAAKRQDRQV
jgi:hypothetical protein